MPRGCPGGYRMSSWEAEGLAESVERHRDWHHFWALKGLPSLQRASLAEAKASLHCQRRVLELSRKGRRWRAAHAQGAESFDVVIFAGTAQDACKLPGLRAALAPEQLRSLRGVRYDHRVCLALILRNALRPKMGELLKGSELVLPSGPIYLVARQDVKGPLGSQEAFAVTLHSTTSFAAENEQLAKEQRQSPKQLGTAALLKSFAELLHLELWALEEALLASKLVHWRQCQVQQPAELLGALRIATFHE